MRTVEELAEIGRQAGIAALKQPEARMTESRMANAKAIRDAVLDDLITEAKDQEADGVMGELGTYTIDCPNMISDFLSEVKGGL